MSLVEAGEVKMVFGLCPTCESLPNFTDVYANHTISLYSIIQAMRGRD